MSRPCSRRTLGSILVSSLRILKVHRFPQGMMTGENNADVDYRS